MGRNTRVSDADRMEIRWSTHTYPSLSLALSIISDSVVLHLFFDLDFNIYVPVIDFN